MVNRPGIKVHIIYIFLVDFTFAESSDLALVDRLSGGKVDLTIGRCVRC